MISLQCQKKKKKLKLFNHTFGDTVSFELLSFFFNLNYNLKVLL